MKTNEPVPAFASASPSGETLLVLNKYYAPDVASTGQLAAELCNGLAAQGISVHVITGQPSYTASAPLAASFEFSNGVHVHRVSLGRVRGRGSMSARLLGYARFLLGAWRIAKRLARAKQATAVLTFHNPPLLGLLGARLAKRYGLRFTYVLQDIHPDILLASEWIKLPRPITQVWEAANRRILRSADTIVVLGEEMKRTLVRRKGVPSRRIHIISPWARPEVGASPERSAIREELGFSNQELILLYAGNFGLMHPIRAILQAAGEVQHLPIRFLFVGDGVRRREIVSWLDETGCAHLTLLPFQPEARFVELLRACDACLVALQSGLEAFAVPSKAFTFLSAGKPLITLMSPDADVARLVKEARCGWNVPGGAELAELLRHLTEMPDELIHRGQNAAAVYHDRFRRELALRQYSDALFGDRVLAREPSAEASPTQVDAGTERPCVQH